MFVEGKRDIARASRSFGIASILLPLLSYFALKNGYKALKEFEETGDPNNEKKIANLGIMLGYLSIIFYLFLLVAALIHSVAA